MATSDVKLNEGTGKAVATKTITEDGETKHLQRVIVSAADGSDAVNSNGRKGPINGSPVTPVAAASHKECPASATTALTGSGSGATGDYLEGLICVVGTSATSQVQIKDGSGTAIEVLPNNAPQGTTVIPWGVLSINGAWSVIAGAGVHVHAIGDFT